MLLIARIHASSPQGRYIHSKSIETDTKIRKEFWFEIVARFPKRAPNVPIPDLLNTNDSKTLTLTVATQSMENFRKRPHILAEFEW